MRLKILLIGANGQLGQYLSDTFKSSSDYELTRLTRNELDLSDIDQIDTSIRATSPNLIINASAYTAVDNAEEQQELAFLINAMVPAAIAKTCADLSIPLIHFSTDYVFSGESDSPYLESDQPNPQGVYGSSKLRGEEAILASHCEAYIFRTAWVYSQRANNFYKSMLRLATNRSELGIVSDQFGSPTYASSIANGIAIVVDKVLDESTSTEAGVYHMTCGGMTNWSGFAKAIFSLEDVDVVVNEISTSDYPTPAKRPAYSVLDNTKLLRNFGVQLPNWQDALNDCSAEKNV